MMARRPSGESPTHLTLYRVARGRVLDLLLGVKSRAVQLVTCHQRERPGPPGHLPPQPAPPGPGPELIADPRSLLTGKEVDKSLEKIWHSTLKTLKMGFGYVNFASRTASQVFAFVSSQKTGNKLTVQQEGLTIRARHH